MKTELETTQRTTQQTPQHSPPERLSVLARLLKYLAWGLSGLTLISVLLFVILTGTNSGVKLVVNAVERYLPQLQIKSVEGTLINGLELEQVRWQTANESLKITKLNVEPDWSCLSQLHLCIASITVQNPHMVVTSQPKVSEHTTTLGSAITLPFRLAVTALNISDFKLEILTTTDTILLSQLGLTIASVAINDAAMQDNLKVKHIAVSALGIVQYHSPSTATAEKFADVDFRKIRQWRYQTIELPEWVVPIEAEVDYLAVDKITVNQGTYFANTPPQSKEPHQADVHNSTSVENLRGQLALTQHQFALTDLQFDWQQLQFKGQASVNDKLSFTSSLSLEASAETLANIAIKQSSSRQSSLRQSSLSFLENLASPVRMTIFASGTPQNMSLTGDLTQGSQQNLAKLDVNLQPMDPLLPMEAMLVWQPLPEFSEDRYQILGGNISIVGDLDEYQMTFNSANVLSADVESPIELVGDLSVHLGVDDKRVNVKTLAMTSALGKATVSGKLEVDSFLDFSLAVTTDELKPGQWFTPLLSITDSQSLAQTAAEPAQDEADNSLKTAVQSFTLSSDINVAGEWRTAQQWNTSGDVHINGRWNKHPLKVRSGFSISNGQDEQTPSEAQKTPQIALKHFLLQLADNQVSASGTLYSGMIETFESSVALSDISQLVPQSRGEFHSSLQADGALTQPNLSANAKASDLFWQGVAMAAFALDIEVDWQQDAAFVLKGFFTGLQVGDMPPIEGEITTKGGLKQHQIGLKASSDNLSAQLAIAGGFVANQWQGTLSDGQVSNGSALQDVDKHISFELAETVRTRFGWSPLLASVSDHCWQHQAASLCFDSFEMNNNVLKSRVSGQALPVLNWLSQWSTPLKEWSSDSLFSFSSELNWQLNQLPDVRFQSDFSPGQWRFENAADFVKIDMLSTTMLLTNGQLDGNLKFASPVLGNASAQLDWSLPEKPDAKPVQSLSRLVDGLMTKSNIRGQVNAENLSLAPIAQIFPEVQHSAGYLNGVLDAQWLWPGSKPKIVGTLNIANGEIVTEQLGLHLQQGKQVLRFDEQQVTLDGEFVLGGGPGRLSGHINWQNDVRAELNLSGTELRYQDYDGSTLSVSPDITVNLAQQQVDIAGKISVPSAAIKIKPLPESARLPSKDVVFNDGEENHNKSPSPLNFALALTIDPQKNKQVTLEAFGLTTALNGNLMLSGTPDKLALNGDINLQDGSYQAWGQQLLIKQGQLIFSGPIDAPYLYSEAIRNPAYMSDNVTAGLRIEGPLRKPSIDVFSVPELSQAEALSYLIRGRSLSSQQTGSDETLFTGMLLSFGLSKSEERIAKAGQKLGVKDLAVELNGEDTDTKVAVSGTVAPGLKVSYGVGVFDAVSEVSMRYQLLPNLYMEAISGLKSTIDIHYEFDDDTTAESNR